MKILRFIFLTLFSIGISLSFSNTLPAKEISTEVLSESLKLSLSIDKTVYVSNLSENNGSLPHIKMRLDIMNDTSKRIQIDFNTAQRFDFSIFYSGGIEVWRWSEDKGFAQVVGAVTLKPGQSLSYAYEHKFVNKGGSVMPEDLYVLKGELMAVDQNYNYPRIMEAMMSFKHFHHY